MIDKNKIKSAAQGYCDATYGTLNTNPFIAEAFRKGANWAINEFLKDLWHPTSEKPILRNGKCLVIYNSGKIDIFKISFVYEMLSNYGKDGMGWKCWAYVIDLFQKEEGNYD